MINHCNRCGKILEYGERREVTCKHITFWEHDTKRWLCPKCYDKFTKYMDRHYNNFFEYIKEVKQ